MKRPIIIGLTGPRGVGKTTVAEILSDHAGFSSIAFGDLLRGQAWNAFPDIDIMIFVDRDRKDGPTPLLAIERCIQLEFVGAAMQHLRQVHGDDVAMEQLAKPRSPREIIKLWAEYYIKPKHGKNYYSRQVVSRIHVDQSKRQLRHVIHDVRFEEEAQAIRNMGGTIWQITRPGYMADPADPTETDGLKFNPSATVANNADASHLQAAVLCQWLRTESGLSWKDIANMGIVAVNTLGAPV